MTSASPQQSPQHQRPDPQPEPTSSPWAVGVVLIAASLLLIASILAIFEAIAALAGDDTLVVDVDDYIYEFSLTTWGWIHLVIGIIGVLIAFGLYRAADWARVATIIIAAISIVANFLWLPYTPWWSILIIVIQIIVIWAVASWRGV